MDHGQSTDRDEAAVERLFDALTAGAQDRPESRALDPLVGRWRTRTEWEPIVGQGVRQIEGRSQAAWTYGGRVLVARNFDANLAEIGSVVLAFDGLVGDYIAFAFNQLSTFFAVERGPYLPDTRTFELDAIEPRRDGGPGVRFRRSVHLVDDDTYTIQVSYPDVPPGTYGPMHVTYERIG